MNQQVSRNPEVIWDFVDGKTVLCDTTTTDIFELELTAGLIWQWCENVTLEVLITRVQDYFAADDAGVVEERTRAFVGRLKDMGLVHITSQISE